MPQRTAIGFGCAAVSARGGGLLGETREHFGTHSPGVLLVLEEHAERRVDRGLVEHRRPERAQRRSPVERFGDPWLLEEVVGAERMYDTNDRIGELFWNI